MEEATHLPELSDHDVVSEFRQLFDRSRELFNDLRDIPKSLRQRHWSTHYLRTFEIYTKLWKFQQDHREVLDRRYKLERWQIGDIAAKIGQLYYRYYLHTSDSSHLLEALQFYTAILERKYYADATLGKADFVVDKSLDILRKKLRYLARLMVVGLLLKEPDVVAEATKELHTSVAQLSKYFPSEEVEEWKLAEREANLFCEVDRELLVLDEDVTRVPLRHRLSLDDLPSQPEGAVSYKLHEAIIVGGREQQLKFNEMTVDMFRMLQTLEWQPQAIDNRVNGLAKEMTSPSSKRLSKRNPHKYLLYKPSFAQISSYLSSTIESSESSASSNPAHHVALLYLSANSERVSTTTKDEHIYSLGGVFTRRKGSPEGDAVKRISKCRQTECFYPDDIVPFTRKPFFVIVDSENSSAFRNVPAVFTQPYICLMSPSVLPDTGQDRSRGSLFTMFLCDPLVAICNLCEVKRLSKVAWDTAHQKLAKIYLDCLQVLNSHSTELDSSFNAFLSDDFLRMLLLRFFVTWLVFRLCKKSEGSDYFPVISPSIPSSVLENKIIIRHLLELLAAFEVRDLFYEFSELPQLSIK